ncbi:DUF805 domain-containing protein [Staphylococcus debuckii]|uniref:DUF805 domain-containing protein n=1 Tax=Staphylococcus debuckii TaxID=2044912 RepID=UPI000F4350D3|nr:DUF805 domain-containing protein [Staphylococcus debuckii]AYU55962.1 DUF805 domain-containing protein [Staphylococcus debuckii]
MEKRVGFGRAFLLFWKNYFNFKGRARRAEFWWWTLWNFLIFSLLGLSSTISFFYWFANSFDGHKTAALNSAIIFLISAGLYLFLILATLIPNIALLIRRFHDTGRKMTVPICFIVATISYNFINPMVRTDAQHHGVLWIFVVLFLLIYVALAVYIFVITLLPSQPEDNKYGRGPAGKKFEQGHAPTSHKSYSESAAGSHHTHYE